jgi:hypothetical protein
MAKLTSASPNDGSERAIERWRRMISGMRLTVDMAPEDDRRTLTAPRGDVSHAEGNCHIHPRS